MKVPIVYFVSSTMISCALFNPLSGLKEDCVSPQYLEIGKKGVIQCNFQHDFYGVLWYKIVGPDLGTPIIKLFNNVKSGYGYDFGEYDVFPNGSLIINNVEHLHDMNFTAVKFDSLSDSPSHFYIKITTTVRPIRPHPFIGVCREKGRSCHARVNTNSDLRCSVRKARPAVGLKWLVRTKTGDKTICCKQEKQEHNLTHSSHCTITEIAQSSSILSLLVCRANDMHDLLIEDEAFVLLERDSDNQNVPQHETRQVMVKRGSEMELSCSEEKPYLIVWKKVTAGGGGADTVLVYGAFEKHTKRGNLFQKEYELSRNGSLVVRKTKVKNEGSYSCTFQNALNEDIVLFEVVVYVPAYPAVEGCIVTQYCVVQAQLEGSLTCSVTHIRPRVTLGWKIVSGHQSALITFFDNVTKVNQKEDVFDVSLTSKYKIQPSTNRVALECAIVETNIDAIKTATIFDLLIPAQLTSAPVGHSWAHDVIIVSISVGTSLFIFIACFVLALCIWCYYRAETSTPTKV